MKKRPTPKNKETVSQISNELVDWMVEHENQHCNEMDQLHRLLRKLEEAAK